MPQEERESVFSRAVSIFRRTEHPYPKQRRRKEGRKIALTTRWNELPLYDMTFPYP